MIWLRCSFGQQVSQLDMQRQNFRSRPRGTEGAIATYAMQQGCEAGRRAHTVVLGTLPNAICMM